MHTLVPGFARTGLVIDRRSRGLRTIARRWPLGLWALGLGLWVLVMAFAQTGLGQDPPPATEKKQHTFKTEEVDLTTKDGFPLKATWYEGDRGTSAAAILMLHDLGLEPPLPNRQELKNLASFFAANGHCVLVPDLRGHGESQNDAAGQPFRPRRVGPVEAILYQADIEVCKRFLIQKNDAEICNIELMMIVTSGAMSIPAMNWCIVDWSYLSGPVKQGQDVKGLVLLSPARSFQNWQMAGLLKIPFIAGAGHPQPLELLVVGGEQHRDFRDTKSLYSSLAASRGRRDEADNWQKHNVFLVAAPSENSGITLVERHPDFVPDKIFDFLEQRILSRADEYGHQKRSTKPVPDPPPID